VYFHSNGAGFVRESGVPHCDRPVSLRPADAATARNADCICVPAHNATRAHVRTLSRVADTVVLIAIYVSLQSSSVRHDKGSYAAGGRFYILKRFKREPCYYRSRQKTPRGYHASRLSASPVASL